MKDSYKGPLSYEDQPEVQLARFGLVSKESIEGLERFQSGILECLNRRLEGFFSITSRLKEPRSILKKLERGSSSKPLLDIYGVRIVVPEWVQGPACTDLSNYSLKTTPSKFPWGVESRRGAGSVRSAEGFRAVITNVIFDKNRIGEVQIMTSKELLTEAITREEYKSKQDPFVVRYVNNFFDTIASPRKYIDFERRQIIEELKYNAKN